MVFLKTFLFTIFVPGMMVAGFPALVLRLEDPPSSPVFSGQGLLGVLLIALGGAVYFSTAFDFARQGQGTPFPLDPPRLVVRGGLYKWVRNPMYLGVLTVITGEAILFRSWHLVWYLLSVAAGFAVFVRFYEEPSLLRRFGAGYKAYCQSVPRWIPRKPGPTGRPSVPE